MKNPDRLYALLPAVYRQRDAGQGYPLQALLRVIGEQVGTIEDNIAQLYENWFIETCEDWVVPYIGDLLGYQAANEGGSSHDAVSARSQARGRILIPRRDIANLIRSRRRKGTLALLENLAADTTGWPARPVEYFRLLGWAQNLHTPRPSRPRYHLARNAETLASIAAQHELTAAQLTWLNPSLDANHPLAPGARVRLADRAARGQTADLRNTGALDHVGTAFEQLARTVDVRRVDSNRNPGRHNIPGVGLFVWRLRSYSVGRSDPSDPGEQTPSRAPAYNVETAGPHCYTFSVLGNDTPLFNRPRPETRPTSIARELNLPVPLERRHLDRNLADYYGSDASFALWVPDWPVRGSGMPVPRSAIKIADLRRWHYRAPPNTVLIDPERGRIMFPVRQRPARGVTAYYHYGFSADLGGGEYERQLSGPTDARIYYVGAEGDFATINAALTQWNADKVDPALGYAPAETAGDARSAAARRNVSAVIEITDSAAYTEKLQLALAPYESLQIRAANRRRPVLRLLDYTANQGDALVISGGRSSRVTLDGLLITGRGLTVRGPEPASRDPDARAANPDQPADPGDICDITIRHCTLVPGWGIGCHCEPLRPSEPSIALLNSTAKIRIEHSILGAIRVIANEAVADPLALCLTDSIWDATDNDLCVLSGLDEGIAFVRLTTARCTVFGKILAHGIRLAENCIFGARVVVARRQEGCVRFCYVPPESRTPRRYACQPDGVRGAVEERFARGELTAAERDSALELESTRVVPVFNDTRYGRPAYAQLAGSCAAEIAQGADDESEMGAFHDLYQPQRAANLRARLAEYTPAGMDAGIINAT